MKGDKEVLVLSLQKREWLLWRKRDTLWVLLVITIVFSYFGYIDYLYRTTWKQISEYIEISPSQTEEEKEFSHELLAKTIMTMTQNNVMFTVFALCLVGASFGQDVHKGRVRGMRLTGMSPAQIFFHSFLTNYLLILFLVFLGVFISLWRTWDVWWGYIGVKDFAFLSRPVIKMVLESFYLAAVAFFSFALLGKLPLIFPYLSYFLIIYFFTNKGLKVIASLLAWGTATAPDQQGFRAYDFWDVDVKGIENSFIAPLNDPMERKIWGEVMLSGYVLAGAAFLLIAFLGFRYFCQKKGR